MNRPVIHLRPVVIRSPQELAALGRIRHKAEKAVEQLLAVLDELAGDPDLEDGSDAEEELAEPNLGWTASTRQEGPNWHGPLDDTEQEHDGREPNLGAFERHPTLTLGVHGEYRDASGDQTNWGCGGGDDREKDDADDEPSLAAINPQPGRSISSGPGAFGSTQFPVVDEGIDQTAWSKGGMSDADLEDKFDDREDGGDDEPNLGFLACARDQRAWAAGGDVGEREFEPEGGDGDVYGEI